MHGFGTPVKRPLTVTSVPLPHTEQHPPFKNTSFIITKSPRDNAKLFQHRLPAFNAFLRTPREIPPFPAFSLTNRETVNRIYKASTILGGREKQGRELFSREGVPPLQFSNTTTTYFPNVTRACRCRRRRTRPLRCLPTARRKPWRW